MINIMKIVHVATFIQHNMHENYIQTHVPTIQGKSFGPVYLLNCRHNMPIHIVRSCLLFLFLIYDDSCQKKKDICLNEGKPVTLADPASKS